MAVLDAQKRSKIIEVLEGNGASFIAVFGSYARGTEEKDSDVDILVSFSDRKSLLDLARIEREVSEEVGLRVELVTENALHPLIEDSVREEMEVLVG